MALLIFLEQMNSISHHFRFLLNRLAATGQVELMNKLNLLMSTEARKEVSFDNRLCNAYLAAGLGREYLENMVSWLDFKVKSIPDSVTTYFLAS